MNIYAALTALLAIASASFGFGWYIKPPVPVTTTVYVDGDVMFGEYASISNSKFVRSRLVFPGSVKAANFQNNFFDAETTEDVVPKVIMDDHMNMMVKASRGVVPMPQAANAQSELYSKPEWSRTITEMTAPAGDVKQGSVIRGAPTAQLNFKPAEQRFSLMLSSGRMMVTIKPDGTLEYGHDYTPDAAAKAFWDAVTREGMQRCRK